MKHLKLRQNSVILIFILNAFFLFLLTELEYTYFALFTDYEDDCLKVFLICMFKNPNLAEKINKFGRKSFLKLNSTKFMELVFSKSGCVICFCPERLRDFFGPDRSTTGQQYNWTTEQLYNYVTAQLANLPAITRMARHLTTAGLEEANLPKTDFRCQNLFLKPSV